MALTEDNSPLPSRLAFDPNAPEARTFPEIPREALARLSQLHSEGTDTVRLAAFLKGAVPAAAALMALGTITLGLVAETTLAQCFAWSVLLLIGVGAMLHSYIRSIAAAFDRAPLTESAKDLRAILLYGGFAWGSGAFLALTMGGPELILFAGLPSLVMTLLLEDRDGPLAFTLPVTVLSLAAAMLRPDAIPGAPLLIVLQSGIIGFIVLRSRSGQRLPGGLLLR